MFIETLGEPFQSLERDWKIVHAELRDLDFARFQEWPEKFLYESGWHVFGLWAFGRQMTPQLSALSENLGNRKTDTGNGDLWFLQTRPPDAHQTASWIHQSSTPLSSWSSRPEKRALRIAGR